VEARGTRWTSKVKWVEKCDADETANATRKWRLASGAESDAYSKSSSWHDKQGFGCCEETTI
jgi:hypothetical protein